MKYVKLCLFAIITINVYSLMQKANTVSAFTLSVKDAEGIFCNTAMIIIAMLLYLALIIKTRIR